jgi:hypothetical protein
MILKFRRENDSGSHSSPPVRVRFRRPASPSRRVLLPNRTWPSSRGASLFTANFLAGPESKPISRLVGRGFSRDKKIASVVFPFAWHSPASLRNVPAQSPARSATHSARCVLRTIYTDLLSCIAFVSSPSSDRTRGSHAPLLSQIIFNRSGSNEHRPRHRLPPLPDF